MAPAMRELERIRCDDKLGHLDTSALCQPVESDEDEAPDMSASTKTPSCDGSAAAGTSGARPRRRKDVFTWFRGRGRPTFTAIGNT